MSLAVVPPVLGGSLYDHPSSPTNLGPEFWSARPALAHIAVAARARRVPPDAVLAAVLARESAYLHPRTAVDIGIGPSPISVFSILYGPPAAGKSRALSVAEELRPVPDHLTDTFRARELGSGEGIVAAYCGLVTPTGPDGAPNLKAPKVARQVRENVLFVQDEGQTLVRRFGRSGDVSAQVIRSAWSGTTIGQANASAERDRQVERGAYSIGLVLGFQPDTIGPLFDEIGGGTPHRFLFVHAIDPDAAADTLADWPGPLPIPAPCDPDLAKQWSATGPVTYLLTDEDIRAEMDDRRLAALRGEAAVKEVDAHADLLTARVAAHMARLDGRTDVGEGDWDLAEAVVHTSTQVRDEAIAHGRRKIAEQSHAQDLRVVRREVWTARAREDDAEQRAAAQIVSAAERVARKVARTGDDGLTARGVKDTLGSRLKDLRDDAVTLAVDRGWIVRDGRGRLRVGSAIGEVPGDPDAW